MRKSIFTMMALLISLSLMAQTFTDKNKVKRKYTKVVTSTIKVDDNTTLTYTGSAAVTAAQVKALYDAGTKPPIPSTIETISFATFANLANVSNKEYKVTPGTYSQGVYHTNLENIVFYMDGVTIQNLNTNAITIGGKSVNVTYKGATLRNVNSYQIQTDRLDKVLYNPNDKNTFVDRLTIDGFTFYGGGRPFHSDGNVRSKGVYDGVLKDFRFINNKVINNLGSKNMVYVGNGFDFDIYGNYFENINKKNNEDNGLLYVKGTGKIHDNRAYNYQGYLARIWLHSIAGKKTVYVYNNLGFSGDKYGLIELQFPPDFIDRGADYADAEVYNNTALDLNKTNDWGGAVLTLYSTYGNVYYHNNLGARLTLTVNGTQSTRDYNLIKTEQMIFKQSGAYTLKAENNLYFDTVSQAVKDLTTFESLFPGIGASIKAQ